jgi:hypothetical protein
LSGPGIRLIYYTATHRIHTNVKLLEMWCQKVATKCHGKSKITKHKTDNKNVGNIKKKEATTE